MTDRSTDTPTTTVSVVVVTYERPEHVARCLGHLEALQRPPEEIVVVDSSLTDRTARIVHDAFPGVTFLRTPVGPGHIGAARDLGMRTSSGDIVAFVDDDAFADEDWLTHLVEPYGDPTVGGVGGRASNGQPGEESEGMDRVGRLCADGTLTGNFAAHPGRVVEVDHLLGANMSFRRSVLEELGGIADVYRGTCLREETDLCFQVRNAGYRLLYAPDAHVRHVAAPYHRGRRFDLRYAYFAQRNHLVLLLRTQGAGSPFVWRYLRRSARDAVGELRSGGRRALVRLRDGHVTGAARALARGASRSGVIATATAVGICRSWRPPRGPHRATGG